jgi:hypothetical protein
LLNLFYRATNPAGLTNFILASKNISEGYNGTLLYAGDPSLRSSWPDVNGKIVLTSLLVPPEELLRDMQRRGAIAVIMQGFSGKSLF